jgi:hypothetical protein
MLLVIIPLMYDQQQWATRVKQLRIGPGPLDREVLLPVLGQVDALGPGIIFEAAYNALRDALQESTTPQCRLRAGTLGQADLVYLLCISIPCHLKP